jgi:hypothetical protein
MAKTIDLLKNYHPITSWFLPDNQDFLFGLILSSGLGRFLMRGRLTPKVPLLILPRLVFLSPFPIAVFFSGCLCLKAK